QEQQRIAQLLQKSISSMRNIIDDLSELTKWENQGDNGVEQVKLENVIDEVKMILSDQIKNEQAKIHFDILEPEIRFSRKTLSSIIYNILSNATKYRSAERTPEIQFRSWREDGHVNLYVRDNG